VVSVCVAVPFLVASARLYRGMHHVSDVLVAILNGLVAALLAWGWLRRDEGRDERRSEGRSESRSELEEHGIPSEPGSHTLRSARTPPSTTQPR
jgi:PAP2 superfamily